MTISIPDFRSAKVLVAGDVMLDRYWFGPVERISPEAPVPVLRVDEDTLYPGGAANVAVNLAGLGVSCQLHGMVGADDQGAQLKTALTTHGVSPQLYQQQDVPTITKLRIISGQQQLMRLDQESTDVAAEHAQAFAQKVMEALDFSEVLVLSDYAKGSLGAVSSLIKRAREHNRQVIVDPKGSDFSRYRGASVITPNAKELEQVIGHCATEEQLIERTQALREQLDLDALLLTRGARGMTLIEDTAVTNFSAEAKEVFDVTGAGDTVVAVLAASRAMGLGWQDAASLANVAAGIVVGKLGAAAISRRDLRLALHRRGVGGRGIVDLPALQDFVADAKARNETVVMTNGCFDILHAGHIAYLEEAKNLGHRLIVALNSDASVQRLKGPSRPINALADRMAIIAGLAAVDWVIPFEEDTPAALIKGILPNVLVKGGDYRAEDVVGGDVVREHGGDVKILKFHEGRSTSTIIERVLEINQKAASQATG